MGCTGRSQAATSVRRSPLKFLRSSLCAADAVQALYIGVLPESGSGHKHRGSRVQSLNLNNKVFVDIAVVANQADIV